MKGTLHVLSPDSDRRARKRPCGRPPSAPRHPPR
jgi:hypothetical protein